MKPGGPRFLNEGGGAGVTVLGRAQVRGGPATGLRLAR